MDRIEGKISGSRFFLQRKSFTSGQQKDSKDRLIGMAEKIEAIKKSVGDFGGKTEVQPANPKVAEELNVVIMLSCNK